MIYDVSMLSTSAHKKLVIKTQQYLKVKPDVESVALNRLTYSDLIRAAQKKINAAARKHKSEPVKVEGLMIRAGHRQIPFKAVDT